MCEKEVAMAMKDEPALPEVLSFMRIIWELDHALNARSKRMLAEFGITGPQRLVLRALGVRQGASPTEVARVLHLHPASVTRLVSALAERGLVKRSVDPSDSRRQRLSLTARGRRADAVRGGTAEAAVGTVLLRSGARRVRETRALLADLAGALHPAASRRR
jgi:MarR family transcriptional regulator, organic hydroperoxide resistance regulator